jgi:hypothetical protein
VDAASGKEMFRDGVLLVHTSSPLRVKLNKKQKGYETLVVGLVPLVVN